MVAMEWSVAVHLSGRDWAMIESPFVEGDYAEGAYGPTIVLVLSSADAANWLRGMFDDLAAAPEGTVIQLDAQPEVVLGAAVMRLNLRVVDRMPGRHLVRDGSGGFTWSCTRSEWHVASLLIEPLATEIGHQYLTSEIEDDALIEVSRGERHRR